MSNYQRVPFDPPMVKLGKERDLNDTLFNVVQSMFFQAHDEYVRSIDYWIQNHSAHNNRSPYIYHAHFSVNTHKELLKCINRSAEPFCIEFNIEEDKLDNTNGVIALDVVFYLIDRVNDPNWLPNLEDYDAVFDAGCIDEQKPCVIYYAYSGWLELKDRNLLRTQAVQVAFYLTLLLRNINRLPYFKLNAYDTDRSITTHCVD